MLLQVEVCGEVSSYRRTFTNYAGCSTSVQRVTERKGHRQPQNWPLSALPSSGIDPTKFTAEQLAFLERKRAYKAGETSNPLQAFTCNDCGGKGGVTALATSPAVGAHHLREAASLPTHCCCCVGRYRGLLGVRRSRCQSQRYSAGSHGVRQRWSGSPCHSMS